MAHFVSGRISKVGPSNVPARIAQYGRTARTLCSAYWSLHRETVNIGQTATADAHSLLHTILLNVSRRRRGILLDESILVNCLRWHGPNTCRTRWLLCQSAFNSNCEESLKNVSFKFNLHVPLQVLRKGTPCFACANPFEGESYVKLSAG